MSTSPRDEMTEDEIAMRKFLKQLGVTAHQELEAALKAAVAIALADWTNVASMVTGPTLYFDRSLGIVGQRRCDDRLARCLTSCRRCASSAG